MASSTSESLHRTRQPQPAGSVVVIDYLQSEREQTMVGKDQRTKK